MPDLRREELLAIATIWWKAWLDNRSQDVIEGLENERNPMRLAAIVAFICEAMDSQQRHDFSRLILDLYLSADPRVARK